MFIRLVPECMEIKSYEKVEYIKQKKPSPDINQVKRNLFKIKFCVHVRKKEGLGSWCSYGPRLSDAITARI